MLYSSMHSAGAANTNAQVHAGLPACYTARTMAHTGNTQRGLVVAATLVLSAALIGWVGDAAFARPQDTRDPDGSEANGDSPWQQGLSVPRAVTLKPLRTDARPRSAYRYAVSQRRVWIQPSTPKNMPAYELVLDFSQGAPRVTTFSDTVRQYNVLPLLDPEIYPFAIEHLLLILPPTHPAHPCQYLSWRCEVPEEGDAVGDDTLRYRLDGEVDAAGFTYTFRAAITLRMPEAVPILLEDRSSGHGYEAVEKSAELPGDARFAPPEGFRRYESAE